MMSHKNIFRQERPEWCPHNDCIFLRRVVDLICGGKLPKPVPHGKDFNIYRICIRESSLPVFDLQVNKSDLDWLRWVFDALDGKKTSSLSDPKLLFHRKRGKHDE